MNTTPDYYQALGLIPGAEPAVIDLAHKTLMEVYDPNKNQSPEVTEKNDEINAAYAVLSDDNKRAEYDGARKSTLIRAEISDFEGKQPFHDAPLKGDWNAITNFYPDVSIFHAELEKISWKLAFTFKLKLLKSQEHEDARRMAEQMKKDYLRPFFGENEEIIRYAELVIKTGEIRAALYLNKLMVARGAQLSVPDAHRKLDKKFTALKSKIRRQRLYEECRDHMEDSAKRLVELHGGKVTPGFWRGILGLGHKIILDFDGKVEKFKNSDEFCTFVCERLASRYA